MERLELFIYNIVGDPWEGVRAEDVVRRLAEHPLAGEIDVYVNSMGGDVFEGMAIYNALARHRGTVTVQVDGAALSIASVIVQAGDRRRMGAGSMMMIHEPWTFAAGDADDMTAASKMLEQVSGQIADIYAARTGQSLDQINAWIKDETWFSAEEAVKAGFADEVVEAKAVEPPMQLAARVDRAKAVGGSGIGIACALRVVKESENNPKPTDRGDSMSEMNNTTPWARFLAKWNALWGTNEADDLDVMLKAQQLKAQAEELTAAQTRIKALEEQVATLNETNEQLQEQLGAEQQTAEAQQAEEDEAFLAQAAKDFRIKNADLDGETGWRARMKQHREITRAAIESIPKDTHNPARAVQPPASGTPANSEVKGRTRLVAATKVA